jgi:hypothetical protein
MLIALVVVEPLLPQAIPLRFSEINYGLYSDSSGDEVENLKSKRENSFDPERTTASGG